MPTLEEHYARLIMRKTAEKIDKLYKEIDSIDEDKEPDRYRKYTDKLKRAEKIETDVIEMLAVYKFGPFNTNADKLLAEVRTLLDEAVKSMKRLYG